MLYTEPRACGGCEERTASSLRWKGWLGVKSSRPKPSIKQHKKQESRFKQKRDEKTDAVLTL